jgi:hypothetical protein
MGGRILIDLSRGAYTSPATAVKEYVSNAWDAGAEKITIRIYNPDAPLSTLIEILDNGCGMTRADLDNKFFRLGRDRRAEEGAHIKTIRGKRWIHGRKGLGKLAGLKLADLLEVTTWQNQSLEGARLDLKEVQASPNDEPEVKWFTPSERPEKRYKNGTLIRLLNPYRDKPIDMEALIWSLSLWFEFGSAAEVTLEHRTGTPAKSSLVNSHKIARSEVFSKLKLQRKKVRIRWKEGKKAHSEHVSIRWGWLPESHTDVRTLISIFSGTRALSTEEDFTIKRGWTNMFGIYKLVAEFHADWLDQMHSLDPADIKREGINWELHPALEAFRQFGEQWLIDTCRGKASSKEGKAEILERTEKIVVKKAEFKNWPSSQRKELIELVSQYASKRALPTSELDTLIDLFGFLLQHGALIRFIQDLKDSGKKDIQAFLQLAKDFTASEMTGLLQVTKSKLQIVRQLEKIIKDPKTVEVPRDGKTDITTFLAQSPWIFDPELRIDHIDQTMKRIVLQTERFTIKQINSLPSEYFSIRPDFVGFKGPLERPLCIELKRPNHEMTEAEANRIVKYRAALLATYPKLEVYAVSGTYSSGAKTLLTSINVEMFHYIDVFNRASNQLGDFIKKLETGLDRVQS